MTTSKVEIKVYRMLGGFCFKPEMCRCYLESMPATEAAALSQSLK